MTISLKSVVISVPSYYLWDSNFYTFLSTARLVLAVATTPPAHSSSRRTCCTLLWKPLSTHAVSIPLILPWYPHPLLRHPVHHPYAWRILGKWSVFCQWFWSVSSYTGRAETRMFVPWWGNKGGIQNACLGYCYYTVFRFILPRKSGHRVRTCTVFLFSSGAIHCFVFPAMVKFQSGVWQGESRRLTTYTVTYRRVLKVWTQGHFVLVPRH